MHVLMLGWEFPPFITGGLGTACHGLTRALDRRGVRVTFVLPRAIEDDGTRHVTLLSPGRDPGGAAEPRHGTQTGTAPAMHGQPEAHRPVESETDHFANVQFLSVPSGAFNPYQSPPGATDSGQRAGAATTQPDRPDARPHIEADPAGREEDRAIAHHAAARHGSGPPAESLSEYGGDMFATVEHYARFVLHTTRTLDFDVIHAHDWMTFPAGLAVARVTGKPLVAHVHSTEFDRSGEHVNQRIYDIERRGMHSAMRVIAVSQLTRNVLINRYGMRDDMVEVVYNGVEIDPPQGEHRIGIASKDKIVLYFGRITMQKGPEYFIRAAKRVLEVMDNVKFVVAGSGDMARQMIEMAADLGIGHKVLFTGFLRGGDVQRVFSMADVYVMPSVSEPFGIAPLEAMGHDVPVLISKSSGVSELLSHALKVDFWDVDDMADKIVAVLRHPPLSRTLREHGAFEVRRITWSGAADRCAKIYSAVLAELRDHAANTRT